MANDSRPILVYDGDCTFCGVWVRYWQRRTADRLEYVPAQRIAERVPGLSPEEFRESVGLLYPDGRRFRGAEAVFHLMHEGYEVRWPLMLCDRLPGFSHLAEAGYRVIADHRSFFYGVTRLLWGKEVEPPISGLTRSVFLRGLAVVYFIAFASLVPQLVGLVGEHGIVPAREVVPTVMSINVTDAFLRILPWAGIVLAAMLFVRVVPMVAVVGLYVLYLHVSMIGQDFFTFQWDALLLETGFAAILVTPFGLVPSYARSTSRIGIWVLRLLLFRLMLESGLVKMLSGDPTWRNWTALTFHYETQPLPTPLAWYAHHLPEGFQKFSCAMVFGAELIVPFFFLMPRKLRIIGAWITITFQILIALTGNYTFFNVLTIVLCISLFDDQHLYGLLRRSVPPTEGPPRQWRWATLPLGTFLIVMGTLQLLAMVRVVSEPPEVFPGLALVNRYGLFAVMTTSRHEIVIEGSEDGREWKPYEFQFKPGDVLKPLPWVAPYQPRLDWQMWFAALGPNEASPWFTRLVERLLEGSPDVLRLFEKNPFPDTPPRLIRATVYDYHFSDRATRGSTHAIWTRTLLGGYFPAVRLR
jgi:predicted DCC family thiol-disulfide oxidoreductase YuxK